MSFYVKSIDDTIEWKNWNNDLYCTIHYEFYGRSSPHPLLTSLSLSAIEFQRNVNTEISSHFW